MSPCLPFCPPPSASPPLQSACQPSLVSSSVVWLLHAGVAYLLQVRGGNARVGRGVEEGGVRGGEGAAGLCSRRALGAPASRGAGMCPGAV